MTKKDFRQFLKLLDRIMFYFFDFDGTIAHTFLHVPNEKGNIIVEAYERALNTIWDVQIAIELLQGVHGLQNRAPGELIRAILEQEEKEIKGGRQRLIDEAKESFNKRFLGKPMHERLAACVPKGKGFPWAWNNKNPEQIITEFLVRAKLDNLLVKIGEHYPTPCSGFLYFYRKLQEHGQESRTTIIPGIISSGHEVFIQQTFAIWGTECPKLLLTDDDLRGAPGIDYVQTVKPNPILMDMLYQQWLQSQRVKLTADQFRKFREVALVKTIFFGDDPKKDGGLAQNSGVRFGHFNPNHDPEKDNETADQGNFSFYDWRLAREMLGL